VLGGLPYKIAKLTMADWASLTAYIKDHTQDPIARVLEQLARATAAGIVSSPDDRQFLLREARKDARNWPPRLTSPDWWDALSEAKGGDAEFLWLVFSKHQPTITREQIVTLADLLSQEDSYRLMSLALGRDLPGAGDPKAAGAGAGSTSQPAPTNGDRSSIISSENAISPTPTSSP
jgi:hypothetical protein